jgi:hypothetical protein
MKITMRGNFVWKDGIIDVSSFFCKMKFYADPGKNKI